MSAMPENWVQVADMNTFAQGSMRHVEHGQLQIALFHGTHCVFATSDVCTHMRARVSDGFFDGEVVQCALHYGKFDVRTGAPLSPPCTRGLQVFAVRIDGSRILVDLPVVADPEGAG